MTSTKSTPNAATSAVWPTTTERAEDGALVIGGAPLPELAATYGTPVYLYDEATLRGNARAFRDAFANAYPRSRVVFAGKAFLNTSLLKILHEEGLGLDVVSGGELFMGLHAGIPGAEMSFHGNNKSREELRQAIEAGIGKVVVDNLHELDLLAELTADREAPIPQTILLRLNPGVDVHTHAKISTGVADSKFGFPIADGQAEQAVLKALGVPGVHLAGYHAHVGSQLFEPQATLDAIADILTFAKAMRDAHGVEMEHLSPGGGFGIAYEEHDAPMPAIQWALDIAEAIQAGCALHDLPLPLVTIEPGRAIVGPAGVTLYTVGGEKRLPGIRTYVSVDGGMADNIRPALYDARYSAAIANRDGGAERETVTIAGKYCESGDLLIEGIELPILRPGDLLAIPATGAYCLAMSSNYNCALRPAVVLVGGGTHRLVRRRETVEDLIRNDVSA
ncbi:MAG: diaminopimelate decarboxylase [Thermomicrobiales bacterium]